MNCPHPSPYLSHSLAPTAELLSVYSVWKNDWHCLSSLLQWTDTPAPIPFILISILNDKPPQSHSLCVCTPSIHTPPAPLSTLPKTPAQQQQCSFVCLPPLLFSCPLARPWTTLVGGDRGMPRQAWGGEGRERRKVCRRREREGSFWKKGVFQSFFKSFSSLFQSCTFLSTQH